MANVTIIEKEIIIVKMLSSNNSARRMKGISELKKWLKDTSKLELSEIHYKRIWTGLFYYFWMSDKPLVQEACAERISKLINCAITTEAGIKFVNGFFSMIAENFDSVSHHRTEKFLMLLRRFLRHCLIWLKNSQWEEQLTTEFSQEIYQAQQILPFSLLTHLNYIFNEEVAKVSEGKLKTKQLIALLNGYVQCLVNLKPNMKSVNDIQCHIFTPLCKQLKFYIKAQSKSDKENVSTVKRDEVDSNEEDDDYFSDDEVKTLDPRPGHVDVVLPFLDFDENKFMEFLDKQSDNPSVTWKAKNIIRQVKNMLKSISSTRRAYSDNDLQKEPEIEQNVEKMVDE